MSAFKTKKDFFDYISQETLEYLSNRYFGKTRCLTTDEERTQIYEQEN